MEAQAILQNINPMCDEPEWCLPPKFWSRAKRIEGYEVYPLGEKVDLPVRKCHCSAIHVMDCRGDIPLEYCTGYARWTNHWTRHSWVVHQGDKVLLESTPNQFDEYYGVTLTAVEFQQFKEIMGM